MNSNIILRIVVIGIGATIAVDIWGFIQSLFKIKSLDYRYVGRWIANFPKGKFYHKDIMMTPPVRSELLIGWMTHYLIGITFSFLLILVYGKEWLEKPLYYPTIVIGLITVIAPFIIMQPALGFGIASSKLPKPNIRRLKSLLTHLIYGVGLYITGLLVNQF
jgi:Protein of unknown function (DUF2938)